MCEWLKQLPWKGSNVARRSRVQIPFLLPMKYEDVKIGMRVKYVCGMRHVLFGKAGTVIKQDDVHIIKDKSYSMFWVEFDSGEIYDCMPESLKSI